MYVKITPTLVVEFRIPRFFHQREQSRVEWQFLTGVSGRPVGDIFLECLILKNGTDRLFRNVSEKISFYAEWNSKKIKRRS
jgi:hypothetical protein